MYPKVLPDDFLDGGVGLINDGRDVTVAKVLRGLLDTTSVSVSDLRAATEAAGTLGGRHLVGGNWFRWDAVSTVNDSTYLVAIKPDAIDSGDPGRFVLDQPVANLVMPFTHATADATVLFTVPTGVYLIPSLLWWNITTSMTGGSSAAIGVSSNKTGFTAKGSLLGGVAGDVLASLTAAASPTRGTPGSRAYVGASRLVREVVAVATAAATPTYAAEQLLYAKTIGTGAAGVKVATINGGTPGAGEASPNAGGTSIAFNAETTGTGTVEIWYLTNANAPAVENSIWKATETIRFDRITSAFTAGVGSVVMRAAIVYT